MSLPDSDDIVLPFQLESSHLRGRCVRVNDMLDHILIPHEYPAPIAHMTAEIVVLGMLLSSMLKYEGIFTLQIQGDGPVSLLMTDVTTAGDVRACANFDLEKIKAANPQTVMDYLGSGYMAFTVDQGPETERYQGIVKLEGESLIESVQHYLMQSEQIASGIRMAVSRQDDGHWRGGAIMLQQMPLPSGSGPVVEPSNVSEDDWRRSMIFLQSCTDEELLSKTLTPDELLFRLFHEEGVRIFERGHVRKGCRCSPERLERILRMMPQTDLDDMVVEGAITMNCHFCNRDFAFDPAAMRSNIDANKNKDE